MTINGDVIPNLLVVNERSLLYENILFLSFPFTSLVIFLFIFFILFVYYLLFHFVIDWSIHIGATQQLDKELKTEKSNIEQIDSRVEFIAGLFYILY